MDGGSTSSKAVLVDENKNILKKEYQLSQGQPDPGREGDPGAPAWPGWTSQGATLEVLGFGATGYAADVLEKTVKSDVNIVETVAHMMSATTLLRRRRRHLRHRRAGHQGPVHAERRHQELPPVEPVLGRQRHVAAGDGRSVRREDHRLRRHRLRGRAGAQVQLRLRRVPGQRPGELPEGRLLEGRAAGRAWPRCCPRTSGNTWCRSRAWPRWARSSSCRAGPSTTWRRSRPRSTTSSERVPGAEVYVHPHCGEAGAIGAAFETLRVVKRRGHSTFIGIDAAIDLEWTATNDESTRCHFCPNNCARTFIDAVTPAGRHAPATSAASPARRARSSRKRRCWR